MNRTVIALFLSFIVMAPPVVCVLLNGFDSGFSYTIVDFGDEEEKNELVVEKEFKEFVLPHSTDLLVYSFKNNKKEASKIGFMSDRIFLDVFSPPPEYL